MLTAEQKELRRGRCGGSDVAAILGLSPFRTPFDVWCDKLGKVAREDIETPPQRRGRLLEEPVARWYAEETGFAVYHPEQQTVIGPEPWMVASFDRLVHSDNGIFGLECKSARDDKGWAESGATAIGLEAAMILPSYYATQVLFYLEISGWHRWDVACWFTMSDDLRRYTIHRDPEQGAQLVAKVREWWQRHVIEGEQPPIDGSNSASAWLLSQFPRQRSEIRQATAEEQDLAERLHDAEKAEKAAKSEKETLKNRLKATIGEAEGIRGDFGKISWKAQGGSHTIDLDRLRAEQPLIAKEYIKEGAPQRPIRPTWSK